MVSILQIHNVTLTDVKQEKLKKYINSPSDEISKVLKKPQALDL